MRRYLLRSLFLSNFILLGLISCNPLRGYKKLTPVTASGQDLVRITNLASSSHFKARMKIFNKTYSGLLILKQTDPNTSHLTFITEVGMKIFDYEITGSDFKLVYIFTPINKPRTIKLLTEDMKLLLLSEFFSSESFLFEKKSDKIYYQRLGNKKYYYFSGTDRAIDRVLVRGALLRKQQVVYKYSDSLQLQTINLRHFGLLRIKMDFNRLEKIKE